MKKRTKICLTGGPSAGKTTVIDILQRELSDHTVTIPEAASIIYKGGFPRGEDPHSKKAAQRSIYFLQLEMERLVEKRSKEKVILCDRGTLDGPGYWPKDGSCFFESVGTSRDQEISRYDLVIHLETVKQGEIYQGTEVRREAPEEAIRVDQEIRASWDCHPRRVVIPSQLSFHAKIGAVLESIEMWLEAEAAVDTSVSGHLQNLRQSISL